MTEINENTKKCEEYISDFENNTKFEVIKEIELFEEDCDGDCTIPIESAMVGEIYTMCG